MRRSPFGGDGARLGASLNVCAGSSLQCRSFGSARSKPFSIVLEDGSELLEVLRRELCQPVRFGETLGVGFGPCVHSWPAWRWPDFRRGSPRDQAE